MFFKLTINLIIFRESPCRKYQQKISDFTQRNLSRNRSSYLRLDWKM